MYSVKVNFEHSDSGSQGTDVMDHTLISLVINSITPGITGTSAKVLVQDDIALFEQR